MGFSGSGIMFAGLSSGIDTEAIISQLIALEALPIRRLQFEQAKLRVRLDATDQYKSLLETLRTASRDLNTSAAFKTIKTLSSDPAVATVFTTNSALPGIYELAVSRLAQAHKVATTAQTDATSALGLSGSFLVNGRAVTVDAGDSLTTVATKINSASAGVTASIIDGGSGNVFLTLTADDSGADNAIAISDVFDDTVLQSLGFVTGSASIRKAITNGAESIRFNDNVTAVGSLLNITVASGNIQINGTNIAIDFSSDSLTDIAANINASGSGASATVVTEEVGGTTQYKLQITGASTPTFTDTNNMLQSLGILQRAAGNELLAAQDAQFTLDSISLTSSSNSVTGVIPGATISLLKADVTTPETTTLTLSRDAGATRVKVEALATAYNAVLDFLDGAAAFDADSLVTGPLFGDSTVGVIQDRMFRALLDSPDGITGDYKNLLAIGIEFDSDGRMSVNASTFDLAVTTSLSNVTALFSELGTFVDDIGTPINDPTISFVSATSATKPSGLMGYLINITQLATQAAHTAGTAFTAASTQTETITFDGKLFGSSAYAITVDVGSTLDDLVNQINTDSKLKDLVVASQSVSNGLVLTSKVYGTPGDFTVVSSLAAGNDNSGIGDTVMSAIGLNVAGTFNGESATGRGQVLTGIQGNANTEGLSIMVTGGLTGDRGNLVYTTGAASVIEDALDVALDFVNGLVTTSSDSIQSRIDDIDDRITGLQDSLVRKEESLRRKFLVMEEAMARFQAQMAQMTALLNSISSTTASPMGF
ncbi:MAG: flagellar filament capping protein FliD [Armatimonadetes bacterium]|nr:flagellar filament capping protein FliD [Armatimonadota bacterium]